MGQCTCVIAVISLSVRAQEVSRTWYVVCFYIQEVADRWGSAHIRTLSFAKSQTKRTLQVCNINQRADKWLLTFRKLGNVKIFYGLYN